MRVEIPGKGFIKSERGDLNPRPPEPHSGTLPGCATFRNIIILTQEVLKYFLFLQGLSLE